MELPFPNHHFGALHVSLPECTPTIFPEMLEKYGKIELLNLLKFHFSKSAQLRKCHMTSALFVTIYSS